MENKTVTIPLTVYVGLQNESEMLKKLYAAGVDNWEGYAEALGFDDEDETYEEIYGTTES